jgi:formylmethanofuran dehydrogenase subunit E
MTTLDDLLQATARLHRHLCPRQVLGVRMGLYGGELLGLAVPQANKRLLTLMETDGCAADGVSVATGCWVGRRTMRMADFGKVAATFVDTQTGHAVRVVPRAAAREAAGGLAPEARGKWEAQLLGYQRMPAPELLCAQPVRLTLDLAQLVSHPGKKALCEQCGEEVMNERELEVAGRVLCRACAGAAYCEPLAAWPIDWLAAEFAYAEAATRAD